MATTSCCDFIKVEVAAVSRQPPRCQPYHLANFHVLPQLAALFPEEQFAMEVVVRVLPFKTNNFVVEQFIDWQAVPHAPLFTLNFPRREMLLPHHLEEMAALVRSAADPALVKQTAERIRMELNPHPAGQRTHNTPLLHNEPLHGMQHKYRETVLFFPSQGQTCHAYCIFCFTLAAVHRHVGAQICQQTD
ncbi:MAG: hypothetical protein OEV91_06835 [Desulfobulbaceae bacterium]|nr:hypothetical protein [Desulfobulbaceae bacterium]